MGTTCERRASASSERKQSRPRERRPVAGSETSTNSLLELQTVKTGVPVSERATSSGASARESDAPWVTGAGVAAAAARAGRGAVRWEARRERWWWRKEDAAARGLGGGAAEVGAVVELVIRVAASGREERAEVESGGGIGWVAGFDGERGIRWWWRGASLRSVVLVGGVDEERERRARGGFC